MANLEYIIEQVEKLKENEKKLENEAIQASETEKKLKSLEKHLNPEDNYKMNQDDTRYITSHPDSWKKKDQKQGYVETDEGTEWGRLNDEGKFIFDKDVEDVEEVIDDKDEIVVDDKDEIENKIEIDGGAALSDKIILPKEKPPHKKKSAFANFTENVGDAFENIATGLPDKMKEVWADKDRKRMFLRGLEIINSSSGLTSLSQAKSPVGKIAEGLLKAESKFTAQDLKAAEIEAQKLRALNTKRGVLEPHEAALLKNYTEYTDEEALNKKNYAATFDIYGLLKKAAFEKKELPTGVLAKLFQGAEAAITEIAGGAELLDMVLKRGGDTKWMDSKQQVTFKNMLGAATKQKIVAQVKELYPVSNKDIEILLQTVGDVGTNPEALRRLVAAQMATREIALNQRKYATKMFEEKDLDFKENSFYAAEKELADSFRESVDDKTLLAMYGSTDDISDSGIIAAKYYQDLQPQFDNANDPFDIFQQSQKKSTEETLELIKKRQLDEKKKLEEEKKT